MGVEVKCGEAAYLSSQISHIDKQLSGFDVYERQDESVKFHKVVMVTADYYQMSDSSKGHLNDVVKSHNACIHVLPFFANDITADDGENRNNKNKSIRRTFLFIGIIRFSRKSNWWCGEFHSKCSKRSV